MRENKSLKIMHYFKFNHPEKKEGEVFLCNVTKEEFVPKTVHDSFENLNYETKRLGKVAYDEETHMLETCLPVFISLKEWNETRNWSFKNPSFFFNTFFISVSLMLIIISSGSHIKGMSEWGVGCGCVILIGYLLLHYGQPLFSPSGVGSIFSPTRIKINGGERGTYPFYVVSQLYLVGQIVFISKCYKKTSSQDDDAILGCFMDETLNYHRRVFYLKDIKAVDMKEGVFHMICKNEKKGLWLRIIYPDDLEKVLAEKCLK